MQDNSAIKTGVSNIYVYRIVFCWMHSFVNTHNCSFVTFQSNLIMH